MARKKYLLLRGKFGNFIVVTYSWYVTKRLSKQRPKMWWIAARGDDEDVLKAMADLTDKHVKGVINITKEEDV